MALDCVKIKNFLGFKNIVEAGIRKRFEWQESI